MTDIPTKFELTDQERFGALWARLSAHMNKRLVDLRGKNDNPALDPLATAALRGEINCLKGLISLGEEPPKDG